MEEAIIKLRAGGVGVIPTDTLYGLVASAFDKNAVERVYKLKGRNDDKPFIILIPSLISVERFGVTLDRREKDFLDRNWPAPLSVIFPIHGDRFANLHRGTDSLAFRVPDNESLRAALSETGPLIAPSANPQGERPAETIEEAEYYFGSMVDFFVDGGRLAGGPSTIVRIVGGRIEIVRKGAHGLPR